MALSPGTRLGVFEILALLGEGGMGEVYRARDTKLNRDVAIKVLPASFAGDADRLARFEREAQVLASLNHPHIAQIHGLEESGGVRALVMELVEGEDLSRRVARGAIPIDEALPIARQIAEALEAAHEVAIVHRDLKPANVKVRDDGTVKVLDFGLAKAMDQGSGIGDHGSGGAANSPTITTPAMTQAGVILGTAAYMSPEQAKGRAVDKRADVWAFGVVLSEMLTGRQMFSGDTVGDVLAAVLRGDLNLAALPVATPAPVRQLLARCLDRDPRTRLRDIGEARVVLDSAPFSDTPTALTSWRERGAVPAMVVAVLAVALTAAVWFTADKRPALAGSVLDTVLDPGAPVQVLHEFGLALSPTGDRMAFVGRDSSAVTALWIRDLAGTTATLVLGTARARWPFWSPDGKQLGFAADGHIRTVDLVSGQASTLCPTNAGDPAGSWSKTGTIIFPHDEVIYRTDPAGSACTPVTARDDGFTHSEPRFFPEGDRFTFRRAPGFDIHVGSLADGSHQQWLADAGSATVVAPDWVLFSRNPVSTISQSLPPLLAQRFDAGSLRLAGAPVAVLPTVATPGGHASYTAVSNGVLVAIVDDASYRPLVWVDRAGQVLDSLSSHAGWTIALSPDDRSIAMGGFSLWVHSRERGVATPLNVTSPERTIAYYPSWSHDLQSIAFVAQYPASPQLRVLRRSDGTVTTLFDSAGREIVGTAWSARDDALVFWRSPGGDTVVSEMWQYSLKDKQARRLFEATPETHGDCHSCLAISPNGQWLLYWVPVNGVADVYLRRYPDIGPPIKVSPQGGLFGVWSADSRTVYYQAPSGSVMAVDVGEAPSQDTLRAPRVVVPAGAGLDLYAVTKDGNQFLRREGRELSLPMRLIVNWQTRAAENPAGR